MFNPEQLLGQLMGDAMSGQLGGRKRKRQKSGLGGLLGGGSGISTATKAKVGLGLLGVAFAAYQHYSQANGGNAVPQPMAGAVPPPAPGGHAMPPPPPPAAAPSPARVEEAMHLLRAMITAAHADGLIDATEREAILGRARQSGMDAESLQALDAEIRAPLTLEQLTVRTPASQRAEVYAAALIAITADTEEERAFLDRLASQLSLDAATRTDIHAQLGIPASS
ncbi:tellurite resistance TerB family protein [Arenimonas alkanexedens]